MIGFGPLKRLLKERGMTMMDLSIAMGKDSEAVSRMVRKDYPHLSSICDICQCLGVGFDSVIEYVDDKERMVHVRWDVLGPEIRKVMSVQKMAVTIGKSTNSIYYAEKRGSKMNLADLKKIADVLGVDVEGFYGE